MFTHIIAIIIAMAGSLVGGAAQAPADGAATKARVTGETLLVRSFDEDSFVALLPEAGGGGPTVWAPSVYRTLTYDQRTHCGTMVGDDLDVPVSCLQVLDSELTDYQYVWVEYDRKGYATLILTTSAG